MNDMTNGQLSSVAVRTQPVSESMERFLILLRSDGTFKLLAGACANP
jgi:hypothetical protein